MSEQSAQRYNVHLFAVVRIKVPNVEAASMIEANQKAYDLVGDHLFDYFSNDTPRGLPGVEHVEYAEELSHCLTDIVGDDEYEQSRWFKNDLVTPTLMKGEAHDQSTAGTPAARG